MLKKAFVVITALSFLLGLTACRLGSTTQFDIESIKTYRDIPNLTETEKYDIENIRQTYDRLTFGHISSTEAFPMPDGTYAGFGIALCELLSELFEIDFVTKHYDSWDVMKTDLDNKKIDFLGSMTPTPERMETYCMSHAIAERLQRIFLLAENENDIEDERDLKGKTVAFLKNTVTEETIRKAYSVEFNSVYVESFEQVAELLKTGEAYAFVIDATAAVNFEKYDFITSKEFFPLAYTQVSLTTAKTELSSVISVLNKYLVLGGVDKINNIYIEENYKYINRQLEKSFSDEELKYINDLISSDKKVSVALEHDNYPICFYNENEDEYQGIAVDVLSEITKLSNIEFEIMTNKDTAWSEIYEGLLSGKYSMVSQLLYTDARKNLFLWSSKPYAVSHYALISKSDYPKTALYQVIRAKVGYSEKTAFEETYKEWFPNSSNYIAYKSQLDAFDALENGEIDLLMASDYLLLAQQNYREIPGFKVNIFFNEPMYSQFGYNIDESMLCSVIDKVQDYIKTDGIQMEWESKVFDYSIKLANMRTSYMLVVMISMFMVLIAVTLLLFKNKRLSESSKRQTATIEAIFTAIPDLIYCKDINNNFTSCNHSFEKFIGLKNHRLIGKNDFEIFGNDSETARSFASDDQKVLDNNETTITEQWLTYPDGTRRLQEIIRTPLIKNNGIIGMMGISRDITDRKATEEALQVASKAKSVFLANMSHEIRTPLNAIIGIANLIKNSNPDCPKTNSSINHIISSSNHLLGILNDILDMSKIESGKLELIHSSFRLLNAYDEVYSMIYQRCVEKNITFKTNLEEISDRILIGDRLRINQVLINLLGNAVKFTNVNGRIDFIVDVLGETDSKIKMKFSISDNGIGISEEQQSRLFKPFEQASSSISANFGGTGLGLSISQNLIKMMGGEIKVESKPNCGSKFYFELELDKGIDTNDTLIDNTDIDLSGKRIMLVEDIDINRMVITENLKKSGAEMVEAENGEIALNMFAKSPVGYYNLILMDIQMPVMDGYQATTAIRALKREDAKTIPIIAMTANVYKEDVKKALETGMNRHLSKPIDINVLINTLAEFLHK